MPAGNGSKRGSGAQAWSSVVRNHARAVLACDFFVTVTATPATETGILNK